MLFCALHFPTLPLDVFARAWPPDAHVRAFVVDSGGHVPRIVASNAAAREAGIRDGMLLSAAYALAPDLVRQPRDDAAERGTLATLATFVLRFTPAVSPLLKPAASSRSWRSPERERPPRHPCWPGCTATSRTRR